MFSVSRSSVKLEYEHGIWSISLSVWRVGHYDSRFTVGLNTELGSIFLDLHSCQIVCIDGAANVLIKKHEQQFRNSGPFLVTPDHPHSGPIPKMWTKVGKL